jgi:hypothetical protein
MLFKSNQQDFDINNEYITTEIIVDSVKPIPFGERLEYTDIFSEKAKNYYSDDYWGEYNVLKKDSLLDKQLKLLYDTTESKAILTKKTLYTKNKNFLKILTKLEANYAINYSSIVAKNALYTIDYTSKNNTVTFSEELSPFNYNFNLSIQIGYNLNYRWSINSMIYLSLDKKLFRKTYDLGASYRMLINQHTRPLILKLSLLASYNNFARNFSIYQNNTSFEFDNKTIGAEKLQFSIGIKTIGAKPKLNLEYNLGRTWWLCLSADYLIPFYSEERLFMKEKSGFFLTRKKGSIALSDNSLNVTYNGEPTTKSHLTFDNYTISLGFMVKL